MLAELLLLVRGHLGTSGGLAVLRVGLGALASLTTVLVRLAEIMTGHALVVLLRMLGVLAMMAVMTFTRIPATRLV
jgi:hypothetical protein